MTEPQQYTIDELDECQWEELLAVTFPPFVFEAGDSLTRIQWIGLGHMCLGKASRIADGHYTMNGDSEERLDNNLWIESLHDIAQIIFNKFTPGDGQL